MNRKTILPLLFCIVAGYQLALQILSMHLTNINNCVLASTSMLDGHAWWRVHQNRYLAGWIITALDFQTFFILGFIAVNILSYFLYKNIWLVIAQMGLVLLLQDKNWIFGWDVLDILMIVLFLYGLKYPFQNDAYFILLFVLFIFNRESALYIPVYMLIDAIINKREKIFPIVILLCGYGIIYLLRQNFISSCYPPVGQDLVNPYGTFQFFIYNIKTVFQTVVPISVICASLFIQNKALRHLVWIIVGTTFYFGAIHEIRVWLILIPIFIYSYQSNN